MKTKEKRFVEIAIVFCLLFLVALPSIAAATEDETLDIYGNANEDDIIDMRDLTFTARMILRLEDETELADANYDGRISVADMTQIGLIILGRESKLTLVDGADRIVTVNKPVERIVTTHPASTEFVKVLEAEDRVVGVELWTGKDELLYPELSKLPVVAFGGYDVDYEKIFELDPNIVLTEVLPLPGFEEMVDTLEPEITVVAMLMADPKAIINTLKILRYVLNTEEDAEEFISWYEGVMNPITEKVAGIPEEDKPEVFYEWKQCYWTFSDDLMTLWPAQIQMAGGVNIAGDFPGAFFQVDKEWVADKDPDVIIGIAHDFPVYESPAIGCGYDADDPTEIPAFREDILSRPELEGGKAVTNGSVYVYYWELACTNRFFVGVAYMAKWLHPELFEDLDPQEIHQEYLTRFMRIDYDLEEHGVFAFPEESRRELRKKSVDKRTIQKVFCEGDFLYSLPPSPDG